MSANWNDGWDDASYYNNSSADAAYLDQSYWPAIVPAYPPEYGRSEMGLFRGGTRKRAEDVEPEVVKSLKDSSEPKHVVLKAAIRDAGLDVEKYETILDQYDSDYEDDEFNAEFTADCNATECNCIRLYDHGIADGAQKTEEVDGKDWQVAVRHVASIRRSKGKENQGDDSCKSCFCVSVSSGV